jgi:hypothetical protein
MKLTSEEILKVRFKDELCLSDPASEFLIILWNSLQFFDDVLDEDKELDRKEPKLVLIDLLLRLPLNPFYQKHLLSVTPLIANIGLQWNAAELAEVSGRADAKSFVWRSSYYQLVLHVFMLEKGIEEAMRYSESILRIYGEELDDYLQEFNKTKN